MQVHARYPHSPWNSVQPLSDGHEIGDLYSTNRSLAVLLLGGALNMKMLVRAMALVDFLQSFGFHMVENLKYSSTKCATKAYHLLP